MVILLAICLIILNKKTMKSLLVVIILLCLCCFSYSYERREELRKEQEIAEKSENYRKIVRDYQAQERIVWKHAQSLPDSFLMEFYPDAKNLDSLRARLISDYEHYGEDGI